MNEIRVQPETETDPPGGGATRSTGSGEPSGSAEKMPSTAARVLGITSMLFFDVAAPLGLYYGLRAAGMSIWVALIAGVVPPAARYVWQFARERKIDTLGLFMITMIALATITSFLIGDPRLLLAKEGAITFVAGLWILGTLLSRLPFLYRIMVPFMPSSQVVRLGELWEESPKIRRTMRTITWVWGIGFLVDSVARVFVAYTLDLDTVPVVNVVLMVGLIFALQGYTQLHLKLTGYFAAVKSESPAERTA